MYLQNFNIKVIKKNNRHNILNNIILFFIQKTHFLFQEGNYSHNHQ